MTYHLNKYPSVYLLGDVRWEIEVNLGGTILKYVAC